MVGRRDFLKRGGAGAAATLAFSAGIVTPDELAGRGSRADDDAPKHLVLVLVDRSGSMAGVRSETIAGINEFLDAQRDKDDMLIALVQFDTVPQSERILTDTFDFLPAAQTPRLTDADYVPRGGTPLYLAIVGAIARLEAIADPKDKVLLAVQTDGMDTEHGRNEVTLDSVNSLIAAKEMEGNWTIAFMAAGLDAMQEATNTGATLGNVLSYAGGGVSTRAAWRQTNLASQNWYGSAAPSSSTFYAGGTATVSKWSEPDAPAQVETHDDD